MPWAIGNYGNDLYSLVPKVHKTISYWWIPDVTLASLNATFITFPSMNREEQNAGIQRTMRAGTPVNKLMASHLSSEPLLESLMTRIKMNMHQMMEIAMDYRQGHAYETACNFLKRHPEQLKDWIPDMAGCPPGFIFCEHPVGGSGERPRIGFLGVRA